MASRGRLLARHRGVYRIAFSPDGGLLSAGMAEAGVAKGQPVLLLDAITGKVVARLEGHTGTAEVWTVAFSAPCKDNQPLLLASGSYDNTVRLWDVVERKCLQVLRGHSEQVRRVTFAPNGSLLASSSDDLTVRLWHLPDGSPGPVLRGHAISIGSVSFSADSTLLATSSYDHMIHLWHMPDGVPGVVLRDSIGWGTYAAFSPVLGSHLLALGSSDKCWAVRLWDPDVGRVVRELRGLGLHKTVHSLVWSPDGTQLVVSIRSQERSLYLLNVASGALLLTLLNDHIDHVNGLAFAPNGKQVAYSSNESTLRLWTVCSWNDRTHRFFAPQFKALVFSLMCVRAQLEQEKTERLPRLPMEMWLLMFEILQVAMESVHLYARALW